MRWPRHAAKRACFEAQHHEPGGSLAVAPGLADVLFDGSADALHDHAFVDASDREDALDLQDARFSLGERIFDPVGERTLVELTVVDQ